MTRARLAEWYRRWRERWGDLSLPAKTFAVVALPITTLLFTGLAAAVLELQERESEAGVRRVYQARTDLFAVYVELLNAETGVRGFLLTRDPTFLEPFRSAERAAPEAMRRLRVARHSAEHATHTDRLDLLVDRRFNAWYAQLAPSASAAEMEAGLVEGKAIMDQIREALAALLALETREIEERSSARTELLRRNRWFVGSAVVGGVGGGILIAWLFIAGVAGRVQGLEKDAGRLAAGQPLHGTPRASRDAIGRLEVALQQASGLLLEREGALRHAAEEQAALNRELEAFSYSVSHDLRAPLRSIDGFAQALVEDCEDRLDPAGRAHLARIRTAAQRMGMLIDDMLLLSRVTRAELRLTRVDVSALASEIAWRFAEQEPGRDVKWRIEPGIEVVGDRALLQTALENLLGNAWKFTSRTAGAVIGVEPCDAPQGWSEFAVRDNGAGFDMHYVDKLFGAFQRLHGAAEFPGTGIGLAIVQRITAKHGGRVRAEGAPGAGATLYVALPNPGTLSV